MRTWTRFGALFVVILALFAVTTLRAPNEVEAVPPLAVGVVAETGDIVVWNAPADKTVRIEIRHGDLFLGSLWAIAGGPEGVIGDIPGVPAGRLVPAANHGVAIEPGYEVRAIVDQGWPEEQSDSVIVSELSIDSLDTETDTISGTAPPDASLVLLIYTPDTVRLEAASSDGDGAFQFVADHDLTGETLALVGHEGTYSGYPAVAPLDVIPGLIGPPSGEVSIGYDGVRTWRFTPGATATLTVAESDGGSVLAQLNKTVPAGYGYVQWTSGEIGLDLIAGMYVSVTDGHFTVEETLSSTSLGTWPGGTLAEYVTAAESVGAGWFRAEVGNSIYSYYIGAPDFVNERFIGQFPFGFDPTIIEVVVYGSPMSMAFPLYDEATGPVEMPVPDTARLSVRWNTNSVWSYGFAPNEPVELTVYDAHGGTLIYQDEQVSDENGRIGWWPDLRLIEGGGLLPGNEVVASDGIQTRTLVIPNLQTQLVDTETDQVDGLASPGAAVTLRLWVPPAPAVASFATTAGGSGLLSGSEVLAGDGVRPGTFSLLTLGQELDPATMEVGGFTKDGTAVGVQSHLGEWVTFETTADGSGNWAVDLGAGGVDLRPGDSLYPFVTDDDGDSAEFWTRPPSFNADLAEYEWSGFLWGSEFRRGVLATIEVFDEPGGTLLNPDTPPIMTNQRDGWLWAAGGLGVELAGGMYVRVSDGRNTKTLVLADLGVDSIDLEMDTVSGHATPNESFELYARLSGEASYVSMVVPDGDGLWSLDLSGEVDLTVQHWITLLQRDDDGDATRLSHYPPVLAMLELSEGTLSPEFDSGTLSYSASVGLDISSVVVTAGRYVTTTRTINGEDTHSLEVELDPGANVIEIVVTAGDGVRTQTYTVTVTRNDPPPPPPPFVFVAPRFEPTVVVVNDDGGSAAADDFTVLLDGEEVAVGASETIGVGLHTITLGGPTALYAVDYSVTCADGSFLAVSGSFIRCTITLDDVPLALVLSAPVPGTAATIDEVLSFTDDAFERDGVMFVEASAAGEPPEVTVAVPVGAVSGSESITVRVTAGNELAIGENPPPGTVLIGGTAWVIEILDADGEPITNFDAPLELSFLIPDGVEGSSLDVYFFDAESGLWRTEPGVVSGGRLIVSPMHLTTFGLFEIAPGGGLLGTAPARGVWLTIAEGGSVAQLNRALGESGAASVWITVEGQFVGYVAGAPDFVNQQFAEFFQAGVPAGRTLVVLLGS
jgi:cadherin-like protein